jgi:hypothetical protein
MIAPTLLVGLGGTGAKIVRRVASLATDEQKNYLGFAVFDTDINELREIKEGDPSIKVVQTSTKLSVGEYLNIDTHARDTWFPVNAILNSKTLTEGAGQVRAISRLAFDTAIRAGKLEPLHEAIQDLYRLDEEQSEQALRVIIVSSLAGGTGSGLILPVALYIKNYLSTRFRQSANITRGFFILPEVFDAVIPGQAERNNLRSNAYATLRELDAFLMKGDNTLSDKYSGTVKMEFPRVASSGFEEYVIRPYDFCFLYDAKNADGKSLNSFSDYLDHSASCIYAQSIGPMNKRSNSSEDNTIRKLCAERGRNRYAGAGTSLLIYPTADVKKYIALNWAKQNVSELWLVFDKMHSKILEQNAKRRSKGENVPDISAAKNYITTVEQQAKDNKAFAKLIVNACTVFKGDGITRECSKWEKYIDALKQKIEVDQSSGQANLDAQKEKLTNAIPGLEGGQNSWQAFVDTFKEMVKYKAMIEKHSEDTARTIAYTIFEATEESVTGERLAYQLETYLRNEEGEFIHPNAVRYFLYKVLELMIAELKVVAEQNTEIKSFFEQFANQFDNPETDDKETVESLSERKVSLLNKLGFSKSLTDDQVSLKGAYFAYANKANDYRVSSVLEAVLSKGIEHIRELSDAFEAFYKSFGGKVASIEKQIMTISKKYEHTKGKTTRYVCATRKCLDTLADQLTYTGNVIEIDSKLADDIYNKIYKYAKLSKKPTDDSYFSDLFENGIIGFFQSNLMQVYGNRVDVDIITALENEAEFEEGKYSSQDVQQYVKKAIRDAWNLSCPFIEKPLGEEREPIYASTYNPSINPKDNSARSMLIDAELENRGGTPDEDITKNMILFYQSFYGLRANDLSKFAPPETSATSKRDGGEYFKAYYELIALIHPEAHKSKAITPHIDRWWHIITKMPDLDEGHQTRQEQDVFAALFWCLAGKFVDLSNIGTEQQQYWLAEAKKLDMDDFDTLIVSNGTPCDHLYEVLDALSIYPELVVSILDYINYSTVQDVNSGDPDVANNGMLRGFLNEFRIKEYPLGPDSLVRSIFDIPLLMKRSVKTDLYNEHYLSRILEVALTEIKKYLCCFYDDKELPQAIGAIICEQFDRFIAGIELERNLWKDIYHDRLFTKVCSIIITSLEKLGLRQDAKRIQSTVSELSK